MIPALLSVMFLGLSPLIEVPVKLHNSINRLLVDDGKKNI
jgi:hypothetical protein